MNKALIVILLLSLVSCAARIEPTSTPTPTPYPSIHPTLPASTKISATATTPDGSVWYSFDEFDGVGGGSMYAQNQGLFRKSIDGVVTHFDITQTIKVLKVAPDGALYIGAGCGVLRYRSDRLQTLIPACDGSSKFKQPFFPFDFAFAANGDVWVAGIWSLARFDGSTWTQYNAKARKILAAPDGSIWADGLPEVPGTNCCFYHLTNGSVVTYTRDAALPAKIDLLLQIYALRN
jgi:hypothetical protein